MSSLVKSFATERLTVSRFAEGKWIEGSYQRGEESCFDIDASVQPMTPNEIVQVPEHRRNSESVKIYTCDRLFQADESKGTASDIVKHDGKHYEIHKVSNWQIGTDLPHYKCIGIMLDGEGTGRDD